MADRLFIGEKVQTNRGEGIVYSVTTWRDLITECENDFDADAFCAECKAQVGINFREDWCEVVVSIGRERHTFQAKDIKLVESRDYGEEDEKRRYFGFKKDGGDDSGAKQGRQEGCTREARKERAKRFTRL